MLVGSYMSPRCELRQSPIHRFGIFAAEPIKKGELVGIWGGFILDLDAFDEIEVPDSYPVQVAEGLWLGPRKKGEMGLIYYMNHSCEPNVGVKGQIVFVARRNIMAGEELVWDYETTDSEEMEFSCNCRSIPCRKRIDGSAWKNPEFQRRNKGYLSWYVEEKIRKRKTIVLKA